MSYLEEEILGPNEDPAQWLSLGVRAFCDLAELTESMIVDTALLKDKAELNLLLNVDGTYLDLFVEKCVHWLQVDRAYWGQRITKEQAANLVSLLVDDFIALRAKLCTEGLQPAKTEAREG
jgi:hypothetical protein